MIEKKLDVAIRDFIWSIVEINSQLGQIHKAWAELLGISEHQWLILMAIDELDKGGGVSGVDVSNKLRTIPPSSPPRQKFWQRPDFLPGNHHRTMPDLFLCR
jgi:hypothetical protein